MIKQVSMAELQEMFGNRLGEITFCTFGAGCKHGDTCEQVVTQEVVDRANATNQPLVTYVGVPKHCFEAKS